MRADDARSEFLAAVVGRQDGVVDVELDRE